MTSTTLTTLTPSSDAAADFTAEDELILAYVGQNRAAYAPTLQGMREKDPTLKRLPLSWCWPAFFFAAAWLLYRKMWGWGIAVAVLPILVSVLFPQMSSTGSGALAVVITLLGKPYYLQQASKRIDKLRARAGSEEELRALVEQAGGVSVPAAAIAGVFMAAWVALVLVAAFSPR
jgi:hypothetical protein